MRITIFGTGYVGLVTGACLADAGHAVVCVDVNQAKIDGLKGGLIPIYEPGLEALVVENSSAGRLIFTSDAKAAVEFGELQFIAVGTPPDKDGAADLASVFTVASTIAEYMNSPKIIVNKSTVPVGTANKVGALISELLRKRGYDAEFEVCSNPEFLKEGAAIEDFTKASRIVVGTNSDWVRAKMRECYAPYNRNHEKLMFMDVESAELTKYAANAMLATKISFMNELANIAERLGADIEKVRVGIGSDPRIGYHFIYPGCGYGGSCFPKDVQALVRTAKEVNYDAELLSSVEAVNQRQKALLFHKLESAFGGCLKGRTIGVWGLSFKPDTDDMRDAPSRTLIDMLLTAGAIVQAYDPVAMEEVARIYNRRPNLLLVNDREAAVSEADALVICTEWAVFRTVDFSWLKQKLRSSIVVDGRNLFDPQEVKKAGLSYFGVGRGDTMFSA